MSDAAEETLLAWDHRIRMLANPNLWRAFALVFGAPLMVLGAVLAVTAGWKTGLTALVGGLVLFGALWLIVGVIVDLMGGFRAHYAVTTRGLYFASGKGERRAAQAASVIGLLAGKPGAAGAGLLAQSEQDAFIAWPDIARVKTRGHYVEVRSRHALKPIGFYGAAETLDLLRSALRSHAPAGTPGVG
jgi:hypothetical protein